jgi:cytidylate kinase
MSVQIFYRITITGDPGSGKTTFARNVSGHTGHELITTGNIFRDIAKEKGISIADVNALAETQAEIDKRVDDYLVGLNKRHDHLVLDSRMAWHFLRDALKIRLTVDPDVAARRIFGDQGRGEEQFSSMDEAIKEVERRKQSEIARYRKLYNVNIGDDSNFDLVINTSGKTEAEVIAQFNEAFEAYQKRLLAV